MENPPAFPICVPSGFQYAHDGMTLRDYFAGQASAGFAARGMLGPEQWATEAYDYADAMLKVRG